MKKMTKLAVVVCAAVMTAAFGFMSLAADAPGPVMMEGTVVSVENGRLTLKRRLGDGTEEVLINITDDTKILESVNGYPIPGENLEKGEAVRVYVGPAMTLSLPPITNGVVILADVPADFGFPVYGTVQSLVQNPDTADGKEGGYTLTTTDGNTYTVNSSTVLLPYLTRNIVRAEDMAPGTPILLWTNGDENCPAKIVIFQGENGHKSTTQEENGWKNTENGWYYYENGEMKKGWLYDGEDWFYLNPSTGIMETGFVTVDGRTYFLKEDGRMLTKATVFTPDENGALHISK
mgnify:FL=1